MFFTGLAVVPFKLSNFGVLVSLQTLAVVQPEIVPRMFACMPLVVGVARPADAVMAQVGSADPQCQQVTQGSMSHTLCRIAPRLGQRLHTSNGFIKRICRPRRQTYPGQVRAAAWAKNCLRAEFNVTSDTLCRRYDTLGRGCCVPLSADSVLNFSQLHLLLWSLATSFLAKSPLRDLEAEASRFFFGNE
jgi:hypothetical protein